MYLSQNNYLDSIKFKLPKSIKIDGCYSTQ